MNVEVTTYVFVESIEEAEAFGNAIADSVPEKYRAVPGAADKLVDSMVVLRALPEAWQKLPMEEFVNRLMNRAFKVIFPGMDE